MISYPTLNFKCEPPAVKGKFGFKPELWDPVRKKHVFMSAEEWVRQWLIKDLNETRHYPIALMNCERGLSFNALAKRYDLVVHDRWGEVYMLIECKSNKIKISESDIQQAFMYNQAFNAAYILVSNGINHFVFERNELQAYSMIDAIPDFPS